MSKSTVGLKSPMFLLGLVCAFSTMLLIGLLHTLNAVHPSDVALAQGPTIRYVAPTGIDSGNNCTDSTTPCATIQRAVDVSAAGDEIRVAGGAYNDVHAHPRADTEATGVVTQVVYISQTLTVRGGYSASDWTTSYPLTQPTTLDAQGQGRVLYITGAISPALEGLRLTGGVAAGLGGGPVAEDFGGGIYVISATLTMRNSQVFSNTAHARAVGEVGSRGRGGGTFFFNSFETTLSNNSFSDNNATLGGGVYFYNSSGVTLNGTTISDNVVNHLGGGTKHCGGLLIASSNGVTLTNNTISGNAAANNGGGACLHDSDNVTLIGNATISNTRRAGFTGNGVGVHIENSKNVTLAGNQITNNKGDDANPGDISGGGVYIGVNSTVALVRNIIRSNEASRGGGLYVDKSDVALTNNVVTDNQAATGSGLYVRDSSPRLWHTTIAGNSGGDGSGVYVSESASLSSHVAMTNTIIVDHTVGVTVTAGSTALLNGVLWYNNSIDSGGMGVTVTNAYTGDPAFTADGYHLTEDSAAIDRGVPTGVGDDIDGQRRPCLTTPDLGADERCWYYYLPVIFKDDDPQVGQNGGRR